MSLSLSLTPEMAEALRNAKGRSAETTASSSNMVKLTRKSANGQAKSLRIYDEGAGSASTSDENTSEESTKFSTSSVVPDAWDDPDAVIALPNKSDFQSSIANDGSSSSSSSVALDDDDEFLTPARLPKAPVHTEASQKANGSTALDEPVVLVNLDQLCGFRVQPEQAAEFAQQLQKDLLGHEAAKLESSSQHDGDAAEESASVKASTAATASSLKGGARFLARSSELFEIGAAIHATRREGPRFTDEFVAAAAAARTSNPNPKNSNKGEGKSSSSVEAPLAAGNDRSSSGSSSGIASGGANGTNGSNDNEDALWVSVRYPALLPDSSQGPPSQAAEVAVPTTELWRQLHENKSIGAVANPDFAHDNDNENNSSSGGYFGPAVLRLRELVRSCSMPLPWKGAMDAEVCSLAARVASSMRLARAEKWRRQRPARVHQLDEVRDLLLAQKDTFEKQLDAASFQRDALLDDKNSGTFAGFAALALEDDGEDGEASTKSRKKKAVKAKAEKEGEEEGPAPVPPSTAGDTQASAAALELEVAQCRSMVVELEARLDTVDELYGLLLDEEEEEDMEEGGSENGDDVDGSDDDDKEASFSRGMGLNSVPAAASGTVSIANEGALELPQPVASTAASSSSSGLPSAPLPGADRAQRSLRPGASGSAKRGAAGGASAAADDDDATNAANDDENDDDNESAAAAALKAEKAAMLRAAAVEQAKRQLQAEEEAAAAKSQLSPSSSSSLTQSSSSSAQGDAQAAAAQAEALGARVSGALEMPLPSLRLDLVDAICAMALGRLPKRPAVSQEAHFAHLAWLHADLRKEWEAEFSALAEETRNWELAVPVAPPNVLKSSTC